MYKETVYDFLIRKLTKKLAKTIYETTHRKSCIHCELFNFYKGECSLFGTDQENACQNLK